MMKYILFLALAITFTSCTLYVEEPEVVIQPYRTYYHDVWVRDPYNHCWILRSVPY